MRDLPTSRPFTASSKTVIEQPLCLAGSWYHGGCTIKRTFKENEKVVGRFCTVPGRSRAVPYSSRVLLYSSQPLLCGSLWFPVAVVQFPRRGCAVPGAAKVQIQSASQSATLSLLRAHGDIEKCMTILKERRSHTGGGALFLPWRVNREERAGLPHRRVRRLAMTGQAGTFLRFTR